MDQKYAVFDDNVLPCTREKDLFLSPLHAGYSPDNYLEVYSPGMGRSFAAERRRWLNMQGVVIKECKAICSKCPVRKQCLEYVRDMESKVNEETGVRNEIYGVVAGLTRSERAAGIRYANRTEERQCDLAAC